MPKQIPPKREPTQCRRAARDAWLATRQQDVGTLTLSTAFVQGWEAALVAVLDAARAEDAGSRLWEAWAAASRKHAAAAQPEWERLTASGRAVCADVAVAAVERAIRRVKWASGDVGNIETVRP